MGENLESKKNVAYFEEEKGLIQLPSENEKGMKNVQGKIRN